MTDSSLTTGWAVLKFGGTSVATAPGWRTIAQAAEAVLAEGLRPLIVCSALAGVSDQLDRLLDQAASGDLADAPDAAAQAVDELRARHLTLARELGLDAEAPLAPYLEALGRDLYGATLLAEASPRLRARVLAAGELLSTTLGAAFLRRQRGGGVAWHDARELLVATGEETAEARRYLAATCDHAFDARLAALLARKEAEIHLTQGFIVGTPAGETALLGRGGSDVSAAYLAAKLDAKRLEIWSDVPGLFTADPRLVPSARLLRHVGYAEAQELASTGGKVLHPRTVEPARLAAIPIHLRCTLRPEAEGTVISAEAPNAGAGVLAISVKRNVTLISMETAGMWQQVGFLADVFAVFKRLGLSVDLVSTSETNVTVTLDPVANAMDAATEELLVRDLQEHCETQAVSPFASISLVGTGLRAILPDMGPVLDALAGQAVYLVSQAASDLNLSFVVEQDNVERLVREFHALQFGGAAPGPVFGPAYDQVMGREEAVHVETWWTRRRSDLLEAADAGTPRYVYDLGTARLAARKLVGIGPADRVLYAVKANPHPDLLRVAHEEGLGFECVSAAEVRHVRDLFPRLSPDRILFTPNFAPRREYAWALEEGVTVTVDNLYALESWPEIFASRDIFIRLDPGRGRGHHAHVRTAGAGSKFGISLIDLPRLADAISQAGCRVVGLHAHVGSGVTEPGTWAETAAVLAGAARLFPDVRVLDLGGGLWVPTWPSAPEFELDQAEDLLAQFKELHPHFEIWLEPGRFVVAEAGVLLAQVTQLKQKEGTQFVGLDVGMNSLLRPALYGAYHEIVNLSRLGEPPAVTAEVVGPICESADVLGHARRLPETAEGDVMLIATAGAYGRAMASAYNLRPPAAETVLPEGGA